MLCPDARPLRSIADRRPAHRRRADGTVQLAPGPRPRRARSSCASRTPTASARRPRTSSRSSTRCAGSSSTGTRSPSSSPQRADRHAEVVAAAARRRPRLPLDRRPPTRSRPSRSAHGQTAASAARTRARARCACGCPTRARRVVHDVIRGETTFENALSGRPRDRPRRRHAALPPRRRGRRPRRRHHPRRPRRRPLLEHAEAAARSSRRWARSRRSTRTCRCCTAPTARSSPSATAPPPCRSCATRGYLPEAVRNYLALLGWGYDDDDEFFTTDELSERVLARARLEVARRCSTSRSCAT